jgi:hypothetical protein
MYLAHLSASAFMGSGKHITLYNYFLQQKTTDYVDGVGWQTGHGV